MRFFPRHSFNLVIQFMDHPFFIVKARFIIFGLRICLSLVRSKLLQDASCFPQSMSFLEQINFLLSHNIQCSIHATMQLHCRLNHFLSSAGMTSNYLCVWQKTFFCSQREMYVKGRTGHIKCKSHILLVHFTFYDTVS